MKYYSLFSVGDYKLASFADYIDAGYGNKYYSPKQVRPIPDPRPLNTPPSPIPRSVEIPNNLTDAQKIQMIQRPVYGPPSPKEVYGPPSPKQNTGVRQAHIRNLGGKAVMVGQSILKAGQNTAGKLIAGGTTLAGQGVGAATSYAGRGVELLAKNPKTSALIAGGTAVAGGGGYLLTRKKRNRR